MRIGPTPLGGKLWGALGMGAVVGFGAWAIGVPVHGSAFLMAATVTILSLFHVPVGGGSVSLRLPVMRSHVSRSDVSRLTWAMAGRSRYSTQTMVVRLRATATRRLAALGIDLDDPDQADAARNALGEHAYRVVMEDGSRRVRRSDVVECVAALERLGGRRTADTAVVRS